MDQTLFPGGYFKEFLFFHHASKTLILTDTIINLELDMIDEPWRTATFQLGWITRAGRPSLACDCQFSCSGGKHRQW